MDNNLTPKPDAASGKKWGRQREEDSQTISMSRAQISCGKGWSSHPTLTTLLAGDPTCAHLHVEALQCIHRDDTQFLQTNGPERTGGFFFSFSLFFVFFLNLKGLWLPSELDLEMSYHRNEKTIAWVEAGQKIVFL